MTQKSPTSTIIGPEADRPKKRAVLIAQRIVEEISSRSLQPGTPLPHERDMLASYAVARGTLREALRFLELQGVIVMKTGPGGGPIVGEASPRALASMIALMLQLEGTPFRAIVEARMDLEPVLAGKAAARITDEESELLHQSVRNMEENIESLPIFLHENYVFHSLLAAAAGNQVFRLMFQSLGWITDGSALGVEYSVEDRKSVVAEHQRIYHAVAAHDAHHAEAAMRVHMGDFGNYMDRFYPAVMDRVVRWMEVSA